VLTLTREWAGGLAIAIARLVEAGRPACPLCGGPLDPKGHDCPRTNGHTPRSGRTMNRDEQQTLLLKGSIEVEGRVVASSNQALL